MELRRIDSTFAASFPSMLLPHIAAREDFSRLIYFAALDEEEILALLVCDRKASEAELLSIAVVTDYQGLGVGSTLLGYAAYALWEAGAQALICVSPLTPVLRLFLSRCGFYEDGAPLSLYLCSLNDVVQDALLENATERTMSDGVKSLGDLSEAEWHNFHLQAEQIGLEVPLHREDYDSTLSQLYWEQGQIKAVILMRVLSPTQINNSWTYLAPEENVQAILRMLFAHAITLARTRFPKDTQISFAYRNPTTEQFLQHILPKSAQKASLLRMILTPALQRNAPLSAPIDDADL